MVLKSAIVVPLYMYPLTADTWQPLHEAALANPQLTFVVVVNPNSGPGEPPWWPDPRYLCEVPKLNRHANVCTLGYVRTNYCKRDVAETCRDVAAYGRWVDDGLFVRGIFFDETPNHHTEHVATYLEAIDHKVKTTVGISGPQLTLHNPGTMPDEKLNSIGPDVTVVFEQSLARFRGCSAKEKKDFEQLDRSRYGIILHSTPMGEIGAVVQEVRQRAEYIFVTDLHDGYYHQFGPSWQNFIEEVQK